MVFIKNVVNRNVRRNKVVCEYISILCKINKKKVSYRRLAVSNLFSFTLYKRKKKQNTTKAEKKNLTFSLYKINPYKSLGDFDLKRIFADTRLIGGNRYDRQQI